MSETSPRSTTSLVALLLGAALWVVSCESPLAPELCGPLPDQTIAVGGTVDVALCFRDPNGEALDFDAFSSDPDIAAVQLRGSTLTITAVSPGTAVVTVVATDPTGLEARQTFQVIVPDRPPTAVGTIDDRELMVGDSAVIDVRGHFAEPDGQPLRYSAAASDPDRLAVSVDGTVVTVVALAKGTVAVTATATDPGGLTATQTFEVTIPNRPPVPVDSIASREIMVDEAHTLDLSPFFHDPDGDPLTYEIAVSDDAVAEAAVAASTLTLTGLAKGAAAVTITAADDEGLTAEQRFTVTVPNRPPVATDTIPSRMLYKSETDTLDLAAWFADPDGDPLAWAAEASDVGVAALDLAASTATLAITPLAEGETVVTVTATDPDGLSAEQRFTVTVPNRPPVATDTIPSRTLYKSEPDTIDLAAHFSDPDDEPLTYAAAASDGSVVALEVSSTNATLIVTPLSEGETVVTITATDPEGVTASQSFAVTVPNRPPAATDTIPAQTLHKRETAALDLTRHFNDPDADALQVEIASTDTLVATATASGTTLTVRAGGITGEATLTITVIDPGGLSASQSFAVTVLNRAPAATTPIPEQRLHRGPARPLDLTAHFADPDGDTLTYEASSSDPWVVRVRVDGSSVILTAWSAGTVEVTVTATDPDSLTADQTFTVIVSNRGPAAVGTFPDLELGRGDRLTLPIDRYFSDPDRDDLSYSASTSDPEVARATTRRNLVALTAVSDGQTTLTLTATDPGGLTATQTSRILVVGQANSPVAVDDIPEQTIAEGSQRTLVISGYFQDPNGDPLTYTATTEDAEVARATVSGPRVTLTAVSSGQTTLTVTATDPDSHSTTLTTPVTVVTPGRGPVAAAPIQDQTVEVGRTRTVSVADHFQDPDGGSLDFAAGSSDPSIVTATASGSDVTLTGVAEGSATVTVTATDSDELSVRQSLSVTVQPRGRAPVAVGVLGGLTVEAGGVDIFDAAPYFRDAEDEDLSYGAGTTDAGIATASASGSVVTVRGIAAGSTTLTVTATDPSGLSATQSAEVTISPPPPGPEAVGTVPDDSVMAGHEIAIGMAPYFTHPDGLSLAYAAGTSNSGIATAAMRGDVVEVKGEGRGTATITVIASDPTGRTAVQQFLVHVWRIDTGFEIQLGFGPGVGATLESTIRAAVATWEAILRDTEFADVAVNDIFSCRLAGAAFEVEIGYLDDLAIVVAAGTGEAGGTLALATTCARRVPGGEPALGVIVFDNADVGRMAQGGDLIEVAMHEIAHVLGIGLDPNWHSSIANPSEKDPDADTHFPGSRAVAAFDAAGGASYGGGKVPVENGGDDRHWRESVMGTESMTPANRLGATDPLSAITLQALADLGYRVNVGFAEPYFVSPAPAAAAAEEAPTLDLGNDVYRGPIIEIDDEGNIIRIVPGERDIEPRAPDERGADLFAPRDPGAAAARADSTITVTIGSRP